MNDSHIEGHGHFLASDDRIGGIEGSLGCDLGLLRHVESSMGLIHSKISREDLALWLLISWPVSAPRGAGKSDHSGCRDLTDVEEQEVIATDYQDQVWTKW